MATKIVVYTKNNCRNCEEVKWALGAAEVEYETRNIEENEEYAAMVSRQKLYERTSYSVSKRERVGWI